jgi:2'-5' RNA ligase
MVKGSPYFLAIIPPSKICEEIIAIQRDISQRFESSKSLAVVPHITLKAPFKLVASDHEHILNWFSGLEIVCPEFDIALRDFGAFHNSKSPVIYIQPDQNFFLDSLQKQILVQFRSAFPEVAVSGLELHYKPHVTVAYRDLKPALFEIAWKEFKTMNFSASFHVSQFFLLQHNGLRWNQIRAFELG